MTDGLKDFLLDTANTKPEKLGETFLGFIILVFLIIGASQGHPIEGASAGAFVASLKLAES